MWKDFFYYSKSERRAVYVLFILIALFLIGILWMPEPEVVALNEEVPELQPEEASREVYHAPVTKEASMVLLSAFDPNLADSIELSRLGLSSYVVRNILKYRQKGGRFRTVASFARVYGLTEEKFKELEPYIQIAASDVREVRPIDTVVVEKKVEKKVFKYPEGTTVDVNVADTAELKKIPGIGSGIAKAIVAYRNRLGGFYSLEQLGEIEYMTPSLMKWFKLDATSIRPLNINEAGLDKLRAHPYLNYYQAKIILEHRKKKGQIKSLSQLALYEEFTEKDLERLSAYISFD